MIKFLVHDSEGNIKRTGQCQDEFLAMQPLSESEFILPGYAVIGIHKVIDGEIVLIPDSIEKHVAPKLDAIEELRKKKCESYITYDGKLLDADTIARENLNGKIVEISTKIDKGITTADKFWRDAENIVHQWETMTDYLTWLKGFAIAISERNTQLYGLSWQKKREVLALATIAEVDNYDIAVNWL